LNQEELVRKDEHLTMMQQEYEWRASDNSDDDGKPVVATTFSTETDMSEPLPRTITVHETTDILKSQLNKLNSSTENEMCHIQKSRLNTPKLFTENKMSHKPKSRLNTPKSSSEKDTSNVLL
jgi:hypothetical protein